MIRGLPLGPHVPNMSGIRVGIIDSGIDANHPQLKGLVIAEEDFTGEGPGDSQVHGTVVALRFVQSYFEGGKQLEKAPAIGDFQINKETFALPPLFSAKVIGKQPATYQAITNRTVEAIRWLAKMQVQTINISMALPDGAADYSKLCNEIEVQDKILFQVAAGNRGADSVVYPAACKRAGRRPIVIGSLETDGTISDYSGPAPIYTSGNPDLTTEARYFRQEGDRLVSADRLAEAEKAYTRSLDANPTPEDTALCNNGLGYIALQRDQKDEALLFFKKATATWPQYPKPYINISIILTEREQFESARRWLALGLEQGADSAYLRDRYARVLLDLDRPVEALDHIETLLQMEPSFKGAVELRHTAQDWSNVVGNLENGTPPEKLLNAFLDAGDDAELVGFLVRKSELSPNALIGDNALPILVRATAKGRYRTCIMLLQLGADVDGRDDKYKTTALMMASITGQKKLTEMLIRKGAKLNTRDYLGFTPLMLAAEAGHTTIAKYLVEQGADPWVQSHENRTALDYAKKFGHEDIVRLLEGTATPDNS